MLLAPVLVRYVTCGTVPFQFNAGVKDQAPVASSVKLPVPERATVVPAAWLAPPMLKLATCSAVSTSLSLASTFPETGVSSSVDTVSGVITDGSSTAATAMSSVLPAAVLVE
nr:hypothetical protein [Ramlibacter montanisoli]